MERETKKMNIHLNAWYAPESIAAQTIYDTINSVGWRWDTLLPSLETLRYNKMLFSVVIEHGKNK